MLTLPAPYPAALKSAFGWLVRLRVVGAPELYVPVLNGEIAFALTTSVSRSLKVDIGGEDFGIGTAADVFDAIYDLGGVISAEALLSVPGADPVTIPMGLYQVQGASWARLSTGFQVDALGRGSLIRDHRFDAPRVLAAGSGIARLTALVQETLPGVAVSLGLGLSDKSLPEVTIDEDRAGACDDIATALGGWLYEKPDGTFEVRSTTGHTVDVDGAVLSQGTAYQRASMFNAVRARSTNEAYPDIVGWAYDDNPVSPTRWGGPFGKKPRFYASPVLTTVAEAQAAAQTILTSVLGRHFSLDMALVQNPTIEPGDMVVQEVDGVPHTFKVMAVKIPLQVGGAMDLDVTEVAA